MASNASLIVLQKDPSVYIDKELDNTVYTVQWDRYPVCYRTKDFSFYKHAVRKQPGEARAPSYYGIPSEELKDFPVFDHLFEELEKWSRKGKDPEEVQMMDKGEIASESLGRSVSECSSIVGFGWKL